MKKEIELITNGGLVINNEIRKFIINLKSKRTVLTVSEVWDRWGIWKIQTNIIEITEFSQIQLLSSYRYYTKLLDHGGVRHIPKIKISYYFVCYRLGLVIDWKEYT